MALNGKKILAVVPARGGSKSIPYKNLCKVGGISLVARAANIATSIDWIDASVLSTDDEKIAQEGESSGLTIPTMRPEHLANDTATSLDMWKHIWIESEKYYKCTFDVSVLLEPTSPLRIIEDVEKTVKAVVEEGFPAAVTVSRTPAHFTPHKTLLINNNQEIEYYLGLDGKNFHNRQSIPAYYHRNGACYVVTRQHLLDEGKIIENAKAIFIDRHLVNIDDQIELAFANFYLDVLMRGKDEK